MKLNVRRSMMNDNLAFIPQIWAQEGLALLEENMVICNLVHRDFANEVARFGETVNTRRPAEFIVDRRVDFDQLNVQPANSDNVPVRLDQWFTSSFTIGDGEGSKSFKDLVQVYLLPAMQNIARGADRAMGGRMATAFLRSELKRAGKLQGITNANAADYALDAREILNVDRVADMNRHLVLGPRAETSFLKNDLFHRADKRGDGGTALESARLGRIFGFDTWMAQNTPAAYQQLADSQSLATTHTATAAGGTQTFTHSGTVAVGEFASTTVEGQPTWILSNAGGTSIVLNEPAKYGTGTNAALNVYTHCHVEHPSAGTYAAGWSKEVVVDTFTNAPQIGQLIAFGSTPTTRHTYTIIGSRVYDSGEQALLLDRPLEAAVADGAEAYPGPGGSFNLAFKREAAAFVNRPLALAGNGAASAVAVYNNLAMRVTMQYDIRTTGTVVNCDMLAGVATLDERQGVILLG